MKPIKILIIAIAAILTFGQTKAQPRLPPPPPHHPPLPHIHIRLGSPPRHRYYHHRYYHHRYYHHRVYRHY